MDGAFHFGALFMLRATISTVVVLYFLPSISTGAAKNRLSIVHVYYFPPLLPRYVLDITDMWRKSSTQRGVQP